MVTARKQSESLGEHRDAFDARNKDLKPNEHEKGWSEQIRPADNATVQEIAKWITNSESQYHLSDIKNYAVGITKSTDPHWRLQTAFNKLAQAIGYASYNNLLDAAKANSHIVVNQLFEPKNKDRRELIFWKNNSGTHCASLVDKGTVVEGVVVFARSKAGKKTNRKNNIAKHNLSMLDLKNLVDTTPSYSRKEFNLVRNELVRAMTIVKYPDRSPGLATKMILAWIGQPSLDLYDQFEILPNRNYKK